VAVTPQGTNVTTASDDALLFSTKFKSQRLLSTQVFSTHYAPSQGFNTSVVFAHGLSYTPDATGVFWQQDSVLGQINTYISRAGSTNLPLMATGPINITVTFNDAAMVNSGTNYIKVLLYGTDNLSFDTTT
jgi:hypothetical protein